MTLKSHLKVTKVKIERSILTVIRRPKVPTDNKTTRSPAVAGMDRSFRDLQMSPRCDVIQGRRSRRSFIKCAKVNIFRGNATEGCFLPIAIVAVRPSGRPLRSWLMHNSTETVTARKTMSAAFDRVMSRSFLAKRHRPRPNCFTQWREQRGERGGGILQPRDIGKTLKFSAITH
jgi:hypothetical protein